MLAVFLYEYPILAAAIVVALGTIGKAVLWVYRFSKRIEASISYIESEMRFNGGSTIRDAVGRIEGRLDVIESNNPKGTQ